MIAKRKPAGKRRSGPANEGATERVTKARAFLPAFGPSDRPSDRYLPRDPVDQSPVTTGASAFLLRSGTVMLTVIPAILL